MIETQKHVLNLTLMVERGDERLSGESADELAPVIWCCGFMTGRKPSISTERKNRKMQRERIARE